MRKTLVAFAAAVVFLQAGPDVAVGGEGPEPWRIGDAIRFVTGREPTTEEYKPANWPSWSSYDDLCNKVRARLTRQGAAYVFIKPEQAGNCGHIGWGFMQDDGSYVCGSTENPFEPNNPAKALQIPAGQPNGYWSKVCGTEEEMLQTMSAATPGGSSGYWHWKSTTVLERDAAAGAAAAEACRNAGFDGIGNNCLDQTVRVLLAYGTAKSDTWGGRVVPVVKDGTFGTVPGFSKLTPNDWFNHFGYIKDGRPHNGGGTGNRLPNVGSSLVSLQTEKPWHSWTAEMSLHANRDEKDCIRIEPSLHSWNAQWFFNPVDGDPGYYVISCRGWSHDEAGRWLVLDVPGGSKDCVCINLYPHHGGDNQRWTLERYPAEGPIQHYTIRNKLSGKVLTVEGGRSDRGARLCQYDDVNHPAQRWVIR